MTFLKRIEEGARLPLLYGTAWRDVERDFTVCAPVPLNLGIQLARRIWHWAVRWAWPSKYDKDIHAAFSAGYNRGWASSEDRRKRERDDAHRAIKWLIQEHRRKNECIVALEALLDKIGAPAPDRKT